MLRTYLSSSRNPRLKKLHLGHADPDYILKALFLSLAHISKLESSLWFGLRDDIGKRRPPTLALPSKLAPFYTSLEIGQNLGVMVRATILGFYLPETGSLPNGYQ
jgi:hypothetical protein